MPTDVDRTRVRLPLQFLTPLDRKRSGIDQAFKQGASKDVAAEGRGGLGGQDDVAQNDSHARSIHPGDLASIPKCRPSGVQSQMEQGIKLTQ